MYNWDIATIIIIGLWLAYTIIITKDNNRLKKELKHKSNQLQTSDKKHHDLKSMRH